MTDLVTLSIAEVGEWYTASKTFTGSFANVRDYDAGTVFAHSQLTVGSLDELLHALSLVAATRKKFLIAGTLAPEMNFSNRASRRVRTPEREELVNELNPSRIFTWDAHHANAWYSHIGAPGRLLIYDLDGPLTPDFWDPYDPLPTARYFLQRLGYEAAGAVMQLTSGQLPDGSNCRMRLYVILDQPLSTRDRYRILVRHRTDNTDLNIDPSPMSSPVSVTYLAEPTFIGMQDPLPHRWLRVPGDELAPTPELSEEVDISQWGGGAVDPLTYAGGEMLLIHSAKDLHSQINNAVRAVIINELDLAPEDRTSPEEIAGRVMARVETLTDWPVRGKTDRPARLKAVPAEVMRGWKHFCHLKREPLKSPWGHQPAEEGHPPADGIRLLKKALSEALDHGGMHGIFGAPGLGKTQQMYSLIVSRDIRANIYLPDHTVIAEGVERIRALGGKCEVIRGRSPTNCRKYAVVEAVAERGLVATTRMLCMDDDSQCPYFDGCPYVNQFRGAKEKIVFMPHAYIGKRVGMLEELLEERVGRPELSLIDEGFVINSIYKTQLHPHYLQQDENPVVRKIAQAIVSGLDIRDVVSKPTLDSLWAEVKKPSKNGLHIYPNMEIGTSVLAARHAKISVEYYLRRILSAVRSAPTNGPYNNVWYDPGMPDVPASIKIVSLPGWSRLESPQHTVIVLDGTMNIELMEYEFPNMRVHEIPVRRNADIVQCWDRTMGKLGMAATDLTDLQSFTRLIQAGVVTMKDYVVGFPAETLHYGKLRGQNALEGSHVGAVVGRMQPPRAAVETIARAVYPHFDLTFGDYVADLENYPGTNIAAKVWRHPDRFIDGILQNIVKGELLQGLDRFRVIHNPLPKPIFVFTSQPFLGVDLVVDSRDLLGPRWVMRMLELVGGFLPLSSPWLMEKFPHLFITKGQADKFRSRVLEWAAVNISPVRVIEVGVPGVRKRCKCIVWMSYMDLYTSKTSEIGVAA